MVKLLSAATLASLCLALAAPAFAATTRIKDIVDIEGVRKNQLIGYGMVVGLNGTGDSVRNTPQTKQSTEGMLERMASVNIRDATLNSKNMAAVIVTADLPAFAAPGARIDVQVSSMGDAKSLLGGQLLVTPLYGADGTVYAVSQGTVQTGAISAGGASGSAVIKGVPTAGRIASGATIEHEGGFQFNELGVVRLTLRNPDFTTAERVAAAINKAFPGSAIAQNPGVIAVRAPQGQDMTSFVSRMELLTLETDSPAKVVIDEVNGIIVMDDNVRISTVAITQGNLTISVQENPQVSQPNPLSQGQTTVTPQSQVKVDEEKGKQFIVLQTGASLKSLVKGLKALGVTPRDMISILQAIKADGALQADIVVM